MSAGRRREALASRGNQPTAAASARDFAARQLVVSVRRGAVLSLVAGPHLLAARPAAAGQTDALARPGSGCSSYFLSRLLCSRAYRTARSGSDRAAGLTGWPRFGPVAIAGELAANQRAPAHQGRAPTPPAGRDGLRVPGAGPACHRVRGGWRRSSEPALARRGRLAACPRSTRPSNPHRRASPSCYLALPR